MTSSPPVPTTSTVDDDRRKPAPAFPYGAVYFRKSHPGADEFDRDYDVAAQDGLNSFRHWFMWGSIEVAPGTFDWDEYDRQLDLAAQHGMRTVIAEHAASAPDWAVRRFAHARYQRADGTVVHPQMGAASATGGFPGLCLDNDDARAAAETFLTTMSARYHRHPGLGGYDVWNECNISPQVCFCPATIARFRDWLKQRYASPADVGRAWRRYGIAEWEDVDPPRAVIGAYPDQLDWQQFRNDNAYQLMAWRIATIRAEDPDCEIIAHGIAAGLSRLAGGAADDWRAADQVQTYGMTWGSSRHGDEPWKQLHAIDLVRSASRGKPFWHAESYAGPLWMQPQVIGKPRDEGRIASPEDVRYWNLASMAGGATGIYYLRWRPLVDGPLFGAFGGYTMAGERTDRSAMMSRVATWANAESQHGLWQSKPVAGDIGIVVVPDTQIFAYAQQNGSADHYTAALTGAYRGFAAHNIQPDWVHIDDIDAHQVLYLPYPVMLRSDQRARITDWVRRGGQLISEGLPGYFGDHGRVQTDHPGWLGELFGAEEDYVEFTPDLLDGLQLTVDGTPARGGIFLQAYRAAGGQPVGHYGDGRVAAIDHQLGSGRTRLIGTFLGAGYGHAADHGHDAAGAGRVFADLLAWSGRRQHATTTDDRVIVRLHEGAGGRSLWALNPTRQPIRTTVLLGDHHDPVCATDTLWGGDATLRGGRVLEVTVPARDATVVRLA